GWQQLSPQGWRHVDPVLVVNDRLGDVGVVHGFRTLAQDLLDGIPPAHVRHFSSLTNCSCGESSSSAHYPSAPSLFATAGREGQSCARAARYSAGPGPAGLTLDELTR